MYSLILHGRRSFELQKCIPHFRALQIAFSALSFSSATAAQNDRKDQNFTASYLVESLGFTTKLAESISRKVSSEGKKVNPDSVLSLLKSHGFTDSQLSSIVTSYPKVLIADAESSLAPKLQFLKSRGASTSELTEILSKVPKILGVKKDKAFSVYYDFIKEVIEADKSLKKLLPQSSLQEGTRQGNKLRNILVLRELGVPQKLLFSLLVSNFQTVSGKERFQETLKKVLEMGFDPTTFKFVQALNAVYQMSGKTTQDKVNLLCTKLGFAPEDVWVIFRKYPNFLMVSENKVDSSIETFLSLGFTGDELRKMVKCFPQCITHSTELLREKIGFLLEEMKWTVKAVVLHPQVISYSMEKRIVPRCNVIKALLSKGLIGTELLPPMGSVLSCTDEVFLRRYVMKHDDDKQLVTELLAIFTKYSV